jgi:hypothetical protein
MSKPTAFPLRALSLSLLFGASSAQAQTNWDQIYQQNDAIQRRIDEQNRQQNEINDHFRREQEQQAQQQQQQQQEQWQQEQNQAQQNYTPRPQPGWTQSFGALVMTDAHSDAWAAVNYTTQELAEQSALRACKEVLRKDDLVECKVALNVSNGAMALAREGSGGLRADWGKDSAEAMAKITAHCTQADIDCTELRTYESQAWFGNEFPKDFMTVVSPKDDASLRNRYAVAVWSNGEDMWAKSAWVSAGSTSFIDTEASAMALCKKDTGTDCVRAQWVSNGFLAIGQDDNGALRTAIASTLARANERVERRCEKDQRVCTLIDSFDAKRTRSARVELPRPWIGISFDVVNAALAAQIGLPSPRGALVTAVTEDGPAARAGLQVGDVILRFAGQPITQSSELAPAIARTKIDVSAVMDIIHYGKPSVLTVTPQLFAK